MDRAALRFMLMAFAGWWSDQQQGAVADLIEENRMLRAQMRGRRVRLTEEDRCRLARAGQRLGRRLLSRETRGLRHSRVRIKIRPDWSYIRDIDAKAL